MVSLSEILRYYHITPQFPPGAVLMTQKMPTEVSDKDLKGRLDLTDLLIFTIDGDDAKDFDDAVSLEKNEKGNYVLGVHIADVSHYVTENSPIDAAAFMRGTSVYLIDTVVPMLPFELSNGLCSLKPGVIRLTLSVFIEITPKGIVKDYKIYESFIISKYRMTYKNVAKILDGDKELTAQYEKIVPVLKDMNTLSKILGKERKKSGSIDFVTGEAYIKLDEKGKPLSVEKYPILDSNSIIEEFMLVANETVAKHMIKNSLPSVFRVHEEPSYEKVERLLKVLPVLGVNEPLKDGKTPKDYQKIIEEVKGKENENIVNYIVLRSMSKAKYSEHNLGHFGLSKDYYCHFTSPIRRYPDLITHRILKASIHKKLDIEKYLPYTVSAAAFATETEINAQNAETDYEKVKKVQFMEDKIGEIFEGNISHVTANGFFVELDNTIEGYVSARTIEDDVYVISDNLLSLIGVSNHKRYTIGDRIKIKVDFADSESLTLDFVIYEKNKRKGKVTLKSRASQKAIKALKKESKELREEREQKRIAIDYETEKAWEAARLKILKPYIKALGVENIESRFVRVSFEDFWNININSVIREAYKADSFENSEKILGAARLSFNNLMLVVSTSLSLDIEENLKNNYERELEKIFIELIKRLKKRLKSGDTNEKK